MEHYILIRAIGAVNYSFSAVKHGFGYALLLGLYLNNNISFVAHVAFFIERQNKELRTKIITTLAIFHKMLLFCS